MTKVTIYHNPRCSKSIQTLKLLQKNKIKPTIINYLDTPPSVQEIKILLSLLAISPRDLMRKKEEAYKTLNVGNLDLSDDDLILAMHANPKLIERPIVTHNNKAIIGRPPENVLEII